ncbi:putative sedoheptulose- -bisphosphatase [Rosellinia necatrix]|uniref:Putative sedoheptulose--bisphosphatase n=1 Tax=Rosellinia necatrix TaxID=77044 RepID=A0A1S8A9B9_ROSNE|nr:putative sedoheptulose- -bisphosphatase [Rosellinia necatrix]
MSSPPSTADAAAAAAAAALTAALDAATGASRPALTSAVLPAVLRAVRRTAASLARAHAVAGDGTANAFGDARLDVDVLAERHFRAEAAACAAIAAASSEEDPVETVKAKTKTGTNSTSTSTSTVTAEGKEGKAGEEEEEEEEEVYAIAFDPLDGSSIIAPNWAVGSIVGIWAGRSVLQQGSEAPPPQQVAAVLGVYGPRTTAIVAVRVPGREGAAVCLEVGLSPLSLSPSPSPSPSPPSSSSSPFSNEGIAHVAKLTLLNGNDNDDNNDDDGDDTAAPKAKAPKYFAPANLRAAAADPRYMALVASYIAERRTLRYSGGLVPDVAHVLVKEGGGGVYLSPVVAGTAEAKLRRAFELLPVALVVECAGGRAVDPADGRRILDRPLLDLNEKGGLVCGTAAEVERAVAALLG